MTSDACWHGTYAPLAEHHRVVAFDLRGHGCGLPVRGRFSLQVCAEDVLAVGDALGLGRFIAVGYSIGGLIAQTLWRRDPDALDGLVLGATAHFPLTPVEWALGAALQAAAKFDARPWIAAIDVPAAVVITTRDAVIIPWRQRALASAIPGATSHEVGAGHLAPIRHPQRLARGIVSACDSVVRARAVV